MKNFTQFAMQIPDILLPKNIDVSTWSVIACDQYTQDEQYWAMAANIAYRHPSTLNLIFPEIYLNNKDKDFRIQKINSTMQEYLANGIFELPQQQCVYVERTMLNGKCRKGLVAAIDLEQYDWNSNSKSMIRATEATIKERIPPRKIIRQNAAVESPHVMLLVNDKDNELIEKIGNFVKAENDTKIYDGNLMMKGGHICGWKIKSDNAINVMVNALEKVKAKNTDSDGNAFLFAVGDGNHSLASAKAVWEDEKAKGITDSPLRYALVEIVNIYDEALEFKPIHRVIFNADAKQLCDFIQKKINAKTTFLNDNTLSLDFAQASNELFVSHLQPVLDEYLSLHQECKIDYIHGDDEVKRICASDSNCTGLLLPSVSKDGFFATINARGTLPRKSFSMGEADEKRFYLECRKIIA